MADPVLEGPVSTWLAFCSTWISNVITVYLICSHIRNYTQPGFQRYICRIVFIVPFYCTASWLALKYREYSLYFETPRDCYEAWVIYNFMSLCFAYVGGPGAVVVKSEGKVIKPSWFLCTCCMKPIPVDGFFLRNCKQGTLQFVIAKPFLAFFTLMLFVMGKYTVGSWSAGDGYPYIAFIYNLCYAVALFWMLLFYVGCDELLHPYKPVLKFLVFKTVIFLTFWQGLAVTFLATRFGWDESDAEAIQNWMICIEMFFAAVGMLFAFPASEYQLGGAAAPGWRWDAFTHAVSITDAIEDIMLQFNPDYKSYVLHTDGGPSENVKRKKFRGKKKKKPAFTLGLGELGEFAHKIKMPKLKGLHARALGLTSEGTAGETSVDEEGGQWHSAVRRDNILTDMRDMTLRTVNQAGVVAGKVGQVAKTGLSWIPGLDPIITELERDQAQLLDSDSDAEMDEENQLDNQLDDEVLNSSSSEDVMTADGMMQHHHGRLRGLGMAQGRGMGRHTRLAADSDDDDDGAGDETDAPSQQRMGGRLRTAATSDSEAAGYRRCKQGAEWAEFPNATHGAAEDGSWAQFPTADGKPAPSDWARFDEVPLDGSPPPAQAPKPVPAPAAPALPLARAPSLPKLTPAPLPPTVPEGEEEEEEKAQDREPEAAPEQAKGEDSDGEVEGRVAAEQVQAAEPAADAQVGGAAAEGSAQGAAQEGSQGPVVDGAQPVAFGSEAEVGPAAESEEEGTTEEPEVHTAGYTATAADDVDVSDASDSERPAEEQPHGPEEEHVPEDTEELSLSGSPMKLGAAGDQGAASQFEATFNPAFEDPVTFNPTFVGDEQADVGLEGKGEKGEEEDGVQGPMAAAEEAQQLVAAELSLDELGSVPDELGPAATADVQLDADAELPAVRELAAASVVSLDAVQGLPAAAPAVMHGDSAAVGQEDDGHAAANGGAAPVPQPE